MELSECPGSYPPGFALKKLGFNGKQDASGHLRQPRYRGAYHAARRCHQVRTPGAYLDDGVVPGRPCGEYGIVGIGNTNVDIAIFIGQGTLVESTKSQPTRGTAEIHLGGRGSSTLISDLFLRRHTPFRTQILDASGVSGLRSDFDPRFQLTPHSQTLTLKQRHFTAKPLWDDCF